MLITIFARRSLEADPLVSAIHAVKNLAEERCASRNSDYLRAVDRLDVPTSKPSTPAYDEAQQPYDPACVYDLETMLSLISRSPESVEETW